MLNKNGVAVRSHRFFTPKGVGSMKRLLCVLLAVGLVLSMAACGTKEPEPSVIEEKEFTFGMITENKYESRFLDLACEFDKDWALATNERIREMNKITDEMTDVQVAQRIEAAEYLYDMMAINKNETDNVTIELKKGSILQMTMKDQDMANSMVLKIDSGLKEVGFQEVTSEVIPVTLAGSEVYGVKTVAKYEQTSLHQLSIPWRRGNYIATITIMAQEEKTVEAVKNLFYAF